MDYVDDDDAPVSEIGDDVGLVIPTFLHQINEAVALIDLCRQREDMRVAYRKPVRHSTALEALGFERVSLQPPQAVEDAATVLAAYVVANSQARTAPSNAAVKKILELVLKNAELMEAAEQSTRGALEDAAGAQAYARLEEAALKLRLRDSPPRPRAASPFRPAGNRNVEDGSLWGPLERGIRIRHGAEAVRQVDGRGGKRVPLTAAIAAARRHGLSVRHAETVEQITGQMRQMLWGEGAGEFLADAAREAIRTLLASSELSGFVIPPANVVLVVGALELLCAWRPDERPNTGASQPLSILVEKLGRALDSEGNASKAPRETICDCVRAWGNGWGGRLFGRNRSDPGQAGGDAPPGSGRRSPRRHRRANYGPTDQEDGD